MKSLLIVLLLVASVQCSGQSALQWTNVDSAYDPLPPSVHIYYTNQPIDTAPFRAFYLVANLKDQSLHFTTDTTLRRWLTPSGFYAKNNQPLVVVNGTFFSFETAANLNVVVKEGEVVAYNIRSVKAKVGDTTLEFPVYRSAIGIDKKGRADVAWIKTDSAKGQVYANQQPTGVTGNFWQSRRSDGRVIRTAPVQNFFNWKMQTAIGGGTVLLQAGEIKITNEFERMFIGKAVNDKHPRTAMGYTADNKLIILVVEGRNPAAGGATLLQEAMLLKDLGCVEALNLDGGGSSCLLVNGKQTITPSDKEGQRAVPAVFLIDRK